MRLHPRAISHCNDRSIARFKLRFLPSSAPSMDLLAPMSSDRFQSVRSNVSVKVPRENRKLLSLKFCILFSVRYIIFADTSKK